jgi:hypothetical protein
LTLAALVADGVCANAPDANIATPTLNAEQE